MIKPFVLDATNQHWLQSLQLFQEVELETLKPHLKLCEEWRIDSGTVLLSPDQRNTRLYGVLSGQLAVHLNTIESLPLTTVEPGECLGEISIIDGYHPSAYVVASESSRLLTIPADVFWRLIDAVPAVNHNLLRIICQRMRHGRAVLIDREKHANIDAMTGLSNRRGLEQGFGRILERCLAKNEPTCLIMADIDHFKKINDQYGHLVGDRVLVLVAQLLRETMRTIDKVARYGGEEFAIMLPDTDLQEATAIAERARAVISNAAITIAESDSLVSVTLSLGVAQMYADESLDALLAKADKALYQAKKLGRNRVCALYNANPSSSEQFSSLPSANR